MARAQRTVREVPWGWAAGGAVFGLLVALVAFAPARWLAGSIERFSGEHLLLADARGTVWNGSAQVILTGGPGSTDAASLPGRVAWTLPPRWQRTSSSTPRI